METLVLNPVRGQEKEESGSVPESRLTWETPSLTSYDLIETTYGAWIPDGNSTSFTS